MLRKYGCKKSTVDKRDLFFFPKKKASQDLEINLRSKCPPVYDQLQLGSCTANAWAAMYQFLLMKEGLPNSIPSRLFIYFWERSMEGDVSQDNGAQVRDGAKVLNAYGVCPETDWPYDITKFADQPPAIDETEASSHKLITYLNVNQTLEAMKAVLELGQPIVGGFSVFSPFESEEVAKTGKVPMPKSTDENLGGHAILIVGCSDKNGTFLVRNSWGSNWGMGGYFTVPYEYFTNPQYADDFWTASLVS